jgi:hypothetical protein
MCKVSKAMRHVIARKNNVPVRPVFELRATSLLPWSTSLAMMCAFFGSRLDARGDIDADAHPGFDRFCQQFGRAVRLAL